MRHSKILAPLVTALALSMSAPCLAIAETTHDGHAVGAMELVLNHGAKWQGDQNMITGMSAIHDIMTANLETIHAGTLSAEATRGIAADMQKQIDFMVSNCVLEPEVDEQLHIVLGEILTGISVLETGEVKPGAVTIVRALNAYGGHFQHPGWQMID